MKDQNAQRLLAKVMNWQFEDVDKHVQPLLLMADYKYDQYQRFNPGKRFVESLALWLSQFDPSDRAVALELVSERLVFFSERELSHLVQTAYPDVIVQERIKQIAEESDTAPHLVAKIRDSKRFEELRRRTLYLGLSDGARTNELRRASDGEISNEQIWQAYEIGAEKAKDMEESLAKELEKLGRKDIQPKFNLVWLCDDFSGSGNTYIRYDPEKKKFKGKIKKIYEQLHSSDLFDRDYYEVYLLLYVATRQAIEHIEYWSERFTSENGFKPLQIRVLCPIERSVALTEGASSTFDSILKDDKYVDQGVVDEHFLIGGNDDARLGFAACALPLVLSHNTPNNSVYILWGPESRKFEGLFPRISRHRET